MPYIQTILEDQAQGKLKELYQRFANPDGTVDEVLKVHSLNPASLEAHCALYVQSMHKPSPLSRAEREMVAVTVSRLNGCTYCLEHHGAGLLRLLPKERKNITPNVMAGDYTQLNPRELSLVNYAEKLATNPAAMVQNDVQTLRNEGLTDHEILDLAQIIGYFAYANRVVLGLGAVLENEEKRGHWPGEEPA